MIPLGPALIGCIWKILHVVWLEITEEVCRWSKSWLCASCLTDINFSDMLCVCACEREREREREREVYACCTPVERERLHIPETHDTLSCEIQCDLTVTAWAFIFHLQSLLPETEVLVIVPLVLIRNPLLTCVVGTTPIFLFLQEGRGNFILRTGQCY